ncbi:hypothetical protein L3X38_005097 [Prunus dulcis]|uniref:Uncharacterized protein n=1 Tax=Prunus dulcis TaxID=3755 RepID=A0AAD4ZQC1_PRUDU|nr:hypothetical protein L3X38_005097 [Prunus dulcis]
MPTDIQFTFSFVSALDICLTSFGDSRTTDYGPLNPASLRLGLTLCHRDLPGLWIRLTTVPESCQFAARVDCVSPRPAREIDGYQELTE